MPPIGRRSDLSSRVDDVQEVLGSTCLLDIPMDQIEGTRLLQFSVPMLTQDFVVIELSLEGLDINRLAANRP